MKKFALAVLALSFLTTGSSAEYREPVKGPYRFPGDYGYANKYDKKDKKTNAMKIYKPAAGGYQVQDPFVPRRADDR